MNSRIVTPATSRPVTLAQAKGYLRVTHTSEDTAIESIIRSATALCEDAARMSFVSCSRLSSFELPKARVDQFNLARSLDDPDGLLKGALLIRGPVASVTAVSVSGAGGSINQLDTSFWALDEEECRVKWLPGAWAAIRSLCGYSNGDLAHLRVAYTAGLGAQAFSERYPDLIGGILDTILNMYENRGTSTPIPAGAAQVMRAHWRSFTNATA